MFNVNATDVRGDRGKKQCPGVVLATVQRIMYKKADGTGGSFFLLEYTIDEIWAMQPDYDYKGNPRDCIIGEKYSWRVNEAQNSPGAVQAAAENVTKFIISLMNVDWNSKAEMTAGMIQITDNRGYVVQKPTAVDGNGRPIDWGQVQDYAVSDANPFMGCKIVFKCTLETAKSGNNYVKYEAYPVKLAAAIKEKCARNPRAMGTWETAPPRPVQVQQQPTMPQGPMPAPAPAAGGFQPSAAPQGYPMQQHAPQPQVQPGAPSPFMQPSAPQGYPQQQYAPAPQPAAPQPQAYPQGGAPAAYGVVQQPAPQAAQPLGLHPTFIPQR